MKWIKCSDELPEMNGDIFFPLPCTKQVIFKDKNNNIFVGYFYKERRPFENPIEFLGWTCLVPFCDIPWNYKKYFSDSITHWMPLPELPDE